MKDVVITIPLHDARAILDWLENSFYQHGDYKYPIHTYKRYKEAYFSLHLSVTRCGSAAKHLRAE